MMKVFKFSEWKSNGTLRHFIHILNHTRALVIITLNERECHEIRHNKGASDTFVSLVGEGVCSNPDMFMP